MPMSPAQRKAKEAKQEAEDEAVVEQQLELARQKFDEIDQDGNGSLDREEIAPLALWALEMLETEAAQMTSAQKDAETDTLMKLADTNGDGVVDFDEFAAWFTPTAQKIQAFQHEQERRRKQKGGQKRAAKAAKASPPPPVARSQKPAAGSGVALETKLKPEVEPESDMTKSSGMKQLRPVFFRTLMRMEIEALNMRKSTVSDDWIDSLFAEFDADNSGMIDDSEWLKAVKVLPARAAALDKADEDESEAEGLLQEAEAEAEAEVEPEPVPKPDVDADAEAEPEAQPETEPNPKPEHVAALTPAVYGQVSTPVVAKPVYTGTETKPEPELETEPVAGDAAAEPAEAEAAPVDAAADPEQPTAEEPTAESTAEAAEGESGAEGEGEPRPLFPVEATPTKPAEVLVTATSITVSTSVPLGAPEPVEWELQYGFRFMGKWQEAGSSPARLSSQGGRVSQSFASGASRTWERTIDGLASNTTYVVRARARTETLGARASLRVRDGGEWGEWSIKSDAIATAKLSAPPASAASEPELEPQLETEMEPEPEPELEGEAEPEPQPEPESDPQPEQTFTTCLERPYVQKEIRWALQHKEKDNIIVLFEADDRRPGYFDYGKAREKYKDTEWEFLLEISGIKYQRDEFLADAMMQNILAKVVAVQGAAGLDLRQLPVRGVDAINAPGWWNFFLSHHQDLGGDQMKTTRLLFEKDGKSAWYDNTMLDRSENAMEEGVKGSEFFILFLTAKETTPVKAEIKLNADISTIPAGSEARRNTAQMITKMIAETVALSYATLDDWLQEKGFAAYADQLKAQGVALNGIYLTEESDVVELAETAGMPKFMAKTFIAECRALRKDVSDLTARIKIDFRGGSVIVILEISEPEGGVSKHTSVSIVERLQQVVAQAPSQAGAAPTDLTAVTGTADLLALIYPQHPVVHKRVPFPEPARRAHARAFPRWIPDEDGNMHCMQCRELFWSVDVRTKLKSYADKTRHHCRSCGWTLCEQCCPADQMLPMDRWASSTAGNTIHRANPPKPKRVCNTCFEFAPAEVAGRIAERVQYQGPPRGFAWMKPQTGILWPERFITLAYVSGAAMSLQVYRSYTDNSEGGELLEAFSIEDVRGRSVEKGEEKWIVQGSFATLTLSGGGLDGDDSRTFAFGDESLRDKFFAACTEAGAVERCTRPVEPQEEPMAEPDKKTEPAAEEEGSAAGPEAVEEGTPPSSRASRPASADIVRDNSEAEPEPEPELEEPEPEPEPENWPEMSL